MREIKFRAWSKKEKQFVDDFIIDCLGNEYQFNKCEFWGDDREVVLMQYTGLKDKNGKEIYEGDIVRITMIDCFEDYEVVWQQDKARFGLVNKKDTLHDSWAFTSTNDFEVLGNIWETPQLLAPENAT